MKTIQVLPLILICAMSGCFIPPTKTHAPSDITPSWRYGDGAIASGDTTEDLVFASKTNDKQVKAIDASTGNQRWAFTDAAMKSFLFAPIYGDSVAYVTSYVSQGAGAEFLIYALDAKTGHELWHTDKFGVESPLLKAGMLIGRTVNEQYLAVDAKSGKELFSIAIDDESWKKTHKGQTIDQKQITEDGKLVLLTSAPSLVKVDFQIKSIQELPVKLRGESTDQIYVEGTTVYRIGYNYIKNQYNDFSAKYRHLYLEALDLNTGKELWVKEETMKYSEIKALEAGLLCVRDWADQLMAYDIHTGKDRWAAPIQLGVDAALLFDKDTQGKLIIKEGSGSNKLRSYEAISGKLLWSVETTEDPNQYWLRVHNGIIYSWTTDQQKVWNSNVTVETQLTAYDLNTGAYQWRRIAGSIGAPGSFVKDNIIVTVDGGIESLPAKR